MQYLLSKYIYIYICHFFFREITFLSSKVGRIFCWIALLLGLYEFLNFQKLTANIYKSCILDKSDRCFLSSYYDVKSYLTLAQITLVPSCGAVV